MVSFGRHLALNTGALFAATALTRLISAAALILIARQLGVEAYGQYVASLSITGLTVVLFSLGLDGLLLREGGKSPERLARIASTGLFVVTLLGAFWVAGITLFAAVFAPETFVPDLVLLAALALWLDGVSSIAWTAFKAALRNHMTLGLMAGSQILWLILVLICASSGVRDSRTYLLASAASSLLSAIVSVSIAVRAFGWHFDRREARQAAIASLPFAASIAFATIYGKADVSIVAHTLGKAAAGLYGPAISLVSAFVLAPAAIYGVLLPALSKMHADDTGAIGRIFGRLAAGMLGLGLLMGVGLAVAARPIVQTLYGQAFAAAGDVLTILSGVLALRCVNYALAAVLAAVGWQSRRAMMQGFSAGVNVGLNLVFVRQWGIAGAAAIYVFSEIVLALGYGALVHVWHQEKRLAPPGRRPEPVR